MAKTLKKSVSEMVKAAKAGINEITAKQALELYQDENIVIVDIRDIRERQKLGFIPGSYHAPRGMLEFWVDPQSPYFKEIFGQDKRFILHCASGWRSALSAATLNEMGFEAEHISDGFSGWLEAEGPVEMPGPPSSKS
jgi:rhodanese-related sulfurtransferase